MEYKSAFKKKKKKEILSFVTIYKNLEDIMKSQTSQAEKDKYFMISFMWNLKKLNSQKQTIAWLVAVTTEQGEGG